MSFYLNPNNALQRLREEWNTYGNLIVAVDFDSTLCPYKDIEMGSGYAVVELVRKLKKAGCTIIIWTASEPERWDDIKKWLEDYDVQWDYFNDNSPKVKFKQRKIYANAFLDDRAGLYEVYNALNQLLLEREMDKVNSFFHGLAEQAKRF
jgi:hypothetical protein